MAYDLRSTRNNAAYDDALARILSTTKDGDERGNQHGRGRGGRGRGRGRGRGGGLDPARDDNDNELASRRARGRGRPRGRGGGRGRGAPAVPEDTLDEKEIREIREQQRENRLAQNAKEQEADEIARFFAQAPPPPSSPLPLPPLSFTSSTHQPTPQPTASQTPIRPSVETRRTPHTVRFYSNACQRTPGSVSFTGTISRTRAKQPQLARQPRSDVWFFFKVSNSIGGKMFVCKLCPSDKAYAYSKSNGTSTLRRHILKEHPYEYVEYCKKTGKTIKGGALAEQVKNVVNSSSTEKRTVVGFLY
ncbi:hypothetical protein M422DRAFT_54036 [Sphaerobolus stellatus SS14]|uniref:BED-type domain-containing protein n=1 Tax=Sphaerobolus stellatus (strain SS14) TaxID=990650 RepID=A0A0C9TJG0_SPHS4|nr:hypothetical protein M422DRAFT_54036 [Sphaerobolus stellatus SS14]